jgi:NAD(P)-dependent dehydrogenase (short-subunit alcohol dehydrogenase family)
MARLAGKVAIVTGASSGIGHATARLFAKEGASVVVAARRQRELDALVADIENRGGRAAGVAGDVCDPKLAKTLVDVAVGRFGGLDVAFNNAGTMGEIGSIADLSLETWRATLDTNLTSAFLGAKHQLPAMVERGGGSVVFTSTFVGYSAGFPGMAAYAAGKAGQGNESRLTLDCPQYFQQVSVVPCGSLSSSLDGSFVIDLADEVEGEVADDGHVLGAVPGAQA